jgi:hypothetical protein
MEPAGLYNMDLATRKERLFWLELHPLFLPIRTLYTPQHELKHEEDDPDVKWRQRTPQTTATGYPCTPFRRPSTFARLPELREGPRCDGAISVSSWMTAPERDFSFASCAL